LPCLRASNHFSVITHEPNQSNDENQLDNTQVNEYTDSSRSGGFSVFVGVNFNLFPTFAVMVLVAPSRSLRPVVAALHVIDSTILLTLNQ